MVKLAQRSPSNQLKQDQVRQYGLITGIMLVATCLYLYQGGAESIWLDEAFSIRDAQNLQWRGNLAVRPLYYLLLHGWMWFGSGEAWLRSLSAVFGVISVFLTYQLGRRLLGKPTGWIAAGLLALSPLFVDYAQEVRMYTLGVCLGLGGTLALIGVLEQPTPSKIRWWVGLRLLMVLTTPLNVLLLLPDLTLLGLRFWQQRRVLKTAGIWLVVGGVIWLPFALSLAKATPDFMGGWVAKVPSPSLMDGITLPLKSFTAYGMQVTSLSKFMPFHEIYLGMLVSLVAIAFLGWRRSSKLLWVAAWGLLPLAMVFVVAQVSSSLWISRYVLFTAPFILIILATGWQRLWRHQRFVAALIALVYAISVSSALVHHYRVQDREDWRGVGQALAAQVQSGDAIFLLNREHRYPLSYYYQAAPVYTLETLLAASGKAERFQSFNQQTVEEILMDLPPTPSRWWFVCRKFSAIDRWAASELKDLNNPQFQVRQAQEFEELTLFLVIQR